MKKYIVLFMVILFSSRGFSQSSKQNYAPKLLEKANMLAQKIIIIDTHIDVPYRLDTKWEDISQRTENGDFDYPRAVKGGLNVPFMSIFVPSRYQTEGGAKEFTDAKIDLVESFAEKWPDKFVMAKSIADVTDQISSGKISLAMGMENGAGIENKLENLKHFYNRGIRYITLCHSKNNLICDSSYDDERKWNGLSPFGKEVIEEMNRLGIMVDISHVTDSTFFQVLDISKAPVIASHSSCRHFTPGWERNMNDEMIKLMANNGGVIQINFGSSFLSGEIQEKSQKVGEYIRKYRASKEYDPDDEKSQEYLRKYRKENHPGYADVSDVVDHIDHVVKLVGIDHVGIGSDFDGVGDSLPTGLKDVSGYPNIIYELLKRGYSEEDIEKICSGNLLRVWKSIERIANELQSGSQSK